MRAAVLAAVSRVDAAVPEAHAAVLVGSLLLLPVIVVEEDLLSGGHLAALRAPILVAGHLAHLDEAAVQAGQLFRHAIVLITMRGNHFRHMRAKEFGDGVRNYPPNVVPTAIHLKIS